ncbi:hypothetical protein [Brumicola blandensis]|uniref:Outer membrane protein beta-barrel domain-containing protein n=1 Tax=Brumicola blandensis TaxID=3075611 RepID=A0AAW8R1M3_9ALTE|nr:hypothetical protein [Alteromonas sp. W409]MDT0583152.1 hypothetical protein [Alteromonas sp. W409]
MQLLRKRAMSALGLFVLLIASQNCYSQQQINNDGLEWRVGAGWPFILVPTVGYQYKHITYYANYKLGLDDGFSLGAEKQFGKHSVGLFFGAVGARKVNSNCEGIFSCIVIFDNQTTQGIGGSYEYKYSENTHGWSLRLEAGYGKESRSDTNRADANIQLVYRF